jgi:hypothetical protein
MGHVTSLTVDTWLMHWTNSYAIRGYRQDGSLNQRIFKSRQYVDAALIVVPANISRNEVLGDGPEQHGNREANTFRQD